MVLGEGLLQGWCGVGVGWGGLVLWWCGSDFGLVWWWHTHFAQSMTDVTKQTNKSATKQKNVSTPRAAEERR